MLISERLIHDDDKLIHVRTHDFQPVIDRVQVMRDADKAVQGDNWFLGSVPLAMVTDWLAEAGVSWDDSAAVQDVIKRKLMSGDFARLRVHEGNV